MEVKAPNPYRIEGKVSIFLAGSIEMGKALPWQDRIVKELDSDEILFLNPRRSDWDSTWRQTIDDPQFRGQVEWELAAQEICDFVVMYFDPKTQSPISLLELGLFKYKMIVFCPEGFWRKGNVDVTCNRYHVEQATSWEDLIQKIKNRINKSSIEKLTKIWN